jgi:hypothetical protein
MLPNGAQATSQQSKPEPGRLFLTWCGCQAAMQACSPLSNECSGRDRGGAPLLTPETAPAWAAISRGDAGVCRHPPRVALQTKAAAQAAVNIQKKANPQTLPIRQYMVRGALVALGGRRLLTGQPAQAPRGQRRRAASDPPWPCRGVQESTVVPVLMQGLQALCKERPDNPVEFLAHYLLQHNPQKPGAPAAGQQAGGGGPS